MKTVIISILGIVIVLAAMVLISKDRKAIKKEIVIKALIGQFIIAFLLVKFPLGKFVVSKVSDVVTQVLDYGKNGIGFVFGSLGMASAPTGFIFATQVLGNIIFLSSLVGGLYYLGAYVCEIIRAGIEGLDKGQMEAARALGMPYSLAMKEVIIPQAVRKILPALVSEFITLLKETSIVGFIGGVDLLRSANIITSQTYRGVEPLLAVGFIYLIMTGIFTKVMRNVEKGLKTND